jgi:hypothetical protein
MSPELSPGPRRRRYGWWIAGGIFAALLALVVGTGIYFAEPIRFVYGLFTGSPWFPGCTTTITREANAGPLWYRIVTVSCPQANGADRKDELLHNQSYWVYVKRSPNAGYGFGLAFSSLESPIPVAIRQTGDKDFEVVLAAPLADGRTGVPLIFGRDGDVRDVQMFEHGKATNAAPSVPRKSPSIQD